MADKHPLESDELAAAYTALSRPNVPLKARSEAVLTILTLEWAHELLARRPEAQARKEEIQAENDRREEAKRLRSEQQMLEDAETRALRAEHEKRMQSDRLYAMRRMREQENF